MAHLWIDITDRSPTTPVDATETHGGTRWAPLPVDGEGPDHDRGGLVETPIDDLVAAAAESEAGDRRRTDAPSDGAILLVRVEASGRVLGALVGPLDGHVRVNGERVAGLRTLRDRDEILLGDDHRVYYSTERVAAVEPFPGPDGACCPRCRSPITVGAPVVRCPGCGVHHCADDERSCWTYAPTCAVCDHPSPLDGDYRWSPEDL